MNASEKPADNPYAFSPVDQALIAGGLPFPFGRGLKYWLLVAMCGLVAGCLSMGLWDFSVNILSLIHI